MVLMHRGKEGCSCHASQALVLMPCEGEGKTQNRPVARAEVHLDTHQELVSDVAEPSTGA